METNIGAVDALSKASAPKTQKSNANMNFTPQPIGVVEPPMLSKTPIQDRLERAKEENARVTLNIEPSKPKTSLKIFNVLNFILVAGAAIVSVDAVMKLVKKISSIPLPRLR